MKVWNIKLDQWETFLFGVREKERSQRSILTERLQLCLIALMSIGFACAFIFSTYHYSTTIERIRQHPRVVDLLKEGLQARASTSVDCPRQQPLCWTLPEYDVQSWKTVTPTRMTKNDLASFPMGRIYYVIDVPIITDQYPLSYTPSYIHHPRFDVYVDGQLLVQGGADLADYSPVVVPLRGTSGTSRVAIAATLREGDRGIVSIGGIHVVGPTQIVREMQVADERISFTYFLLFLLSKGSIFLIFALFYFFSDSRRSLFYFLIYAFASAIEGLFLGDFFAAQISTYARVALFRMMTMVGSSALLIFFLDYFLARNIRSKALQFNRVMLAIYAVICGFYYLSQGALVTAQHTRWFYDIYTYGVLLTGFSLGLLATRFFRRHDISSRYSRSVLMFTGVILVYTLLITWEKFFNEAKGFDKRAIFDLIFFYFIASRTASDSGFNEKRIVNLEGHMIEKERMEDELQEAAMINRAFLPKEIPLFDDFKIDVLHKSLTESGGDWYAVESRSRFVHVVMSDITGHGVQASIVAATCKTVMSHFKLQEAEALDSADFINVYGQRLNQILFEHGAGRHVATFLGLTYDRETRKLYHVTGGHPSPILLGPSGELKPLQSRHSALGIKPEIHYELQDVEIQPGSDIVCFTDGLPLQQNLRIFKPHLEHLHRGRSQMHPATLLYGFMTQEKNLKNANADDITIIWIRIP